MLHIKDLGTDATLLIKDLTNLGADAGSTDNGVQRVCLLCHSDVYGRENVFQLLLVLPRVSHRVHINLWPWDTTPTFSTKNQINNAQHSTGTFVWASKPSLNRLLQFQLSWNGDDTALQIALLWFLLMIKRFHGFRKITISDSHWQLVWHH